jgi:predicted permease
MLDTLTHDIRYALRGLARAPGFTLAVVVTLALGIGANTTMFGVLDALLLKPPRYVERPDDVVRVYFRQTFDVMGTFTGTSTSVPSYEALRSGVPAFASAAAFTGSSQSFGRGAQASQVRVAVVTHTYFSTLGVRPVLGRYFGESDDRPGGEGTAVLGYRFWRTRFGGDSTVLGRALPIGRGSYTVIGVAPDGFTGMRPEEPDVWLPLGAAAGDVNSVEALTSRNWHWIGVVARMRPGADRAAAAALATTIYRRDLAANGREDTNVTVLLGPIQAARGPGMSDNARVSLWVGAVALIVLLVACANVANLLLARGVRRRREIAVRLGLGASRGRIAWQLLVESLVLGAVGGAAALLVATWGGSLVRTYLLEDLPATESLLDWRVLGFTAATALVAGVLAGVAPAFQSSRVDLSTALKDAGRSVTGSHSRLRAALLAAQVAFTLVLLVGAGLFVRSLRNVQALDLGLDVSHLLVATVSLPPADVDASVSDAIYLRMLERVRTYPGIAAAAASVGTPFGWSHATDVRASGRDSIPQVKDGGPYFFAVTPDYFRTLGIRILSGRGFTDGDGPRSGRVAIVGKTFARLVWPGKNALGQCLYVGGNDSTCVQVVGVAADARRDGVIEGEAMVYFLPLVQRIVDQRINALLIRTAGAPGAVSAGVQRLLQQSQGDLPYVRLEPLEDAVAPQLRSWRMGATMFTAFGLLALLIAAMGLYGVTSYSVSQRTQEIGVRIALGARASSVLGMVVGQGVRAAAIGSAAGILGALALGRAIAALLYGVKPTDPLVLLGVVAILLAVAAAASFVPALRASRVDPMEALRYE